MKLDIDRAYSERYFRTKYPESLCGAYWMASQDMTAKLGAAFARSLMWRSPDDIGAVPNVRIGLAGAPDVGKTTFVHGFDSVIDGALVLEQSEQIAGADTPIMPESWFSSSLPPKEMVQSLRLTKEMGMVLHRDAMWNKMFKPSRLSNFDSPHRYGTVAVELIEHPYADENTNYDCIIMFEKRRDYSLAALFDKSRKFGHVEREMSVFATDEFRSTERFKALQQELKPFSTFCAA